jgi:hypothetical protein
MRQVVVVALGALLAIMGSVAGGSSRPGAAATVQDRIRAVNVVPPGESGFVSAAALVQGTAGTDTTYGAHVQDQLQMYGSWRYKPFQFEPQLATTSVPNGGTHLLAGADATLPAGTDSSGAQCHLVSVNNLDTPTMKWELTTDDLVLNALIGRTGAPWLAYAGGGNGAILRAAQEAAAELTASSGSSDPTTWNEPVETTDFNANALGAASVQSEVSPLPNRGSDGQAVEALVASAPATAAQASPAASPALTNTAAAGGGAAVAGLLALAAGGAAAGGRRRGRREARRR